MSAKTILVVDDEEDLRSLIMRDLRRLGFSVHGASGGNEAWDLLRNLKVDLVLSDVRMANGDGILLARRMHEEYPHPAGMILMSGFADADLSDSSQWGVREIVHKPFQRKELHEAVMRALGAA